MAIDSSDIENALVLKLASDATLLALVPNGVYIDEAPPGSTQFVIVSLVDEADEATFGQRAFEDALYLVKAVELSKVDVKNNKAAAARIDALLDPQPPAAPASLTVSGYSLMLMARESRIRMTEVDAEDETIRWQHRGGNYRVMVSPS